jgi:hypothetical protein
MFMGLPDPDPLVRGMDPDPDLSSCKNSKKNLDSYYFVTLDFLSSKNDVNVASKSNPLVRGMDPRIRIHPKMSWIRYTAKKPSVPTKIDSLFDKCSGSF